ncbi:2225_t:CDS:2, partial [Gigaspora rosea]
MTTTQAYFGPHTQVYTNETSFQNRASFVKPDLTQHIIKQPQNRFVSPVTPAPKSGKKEKGFESIQQHALEELIDALKKALERFNKNPPKFQNNDDYMTIVHVRSYFDKAISNLQGDVCEYQSSSKARRVIEGTPPKKSWRVINGIIVPIEKNGGTEISSSSGFNNQLPIISRK